MVAESSHQKIKRSDGSSKSDSGSMICAAALDLLREGIFYLTNDGTVVCNRALRTLLEFDSEEITRDELLGRFASHSSLEIRQRITALANGVGNELYLSIKLHSGSLIDLHVRTSTVATPNGSAVCGLVREIVGSQPGAGQIEALWLLNAIFDSIEDGILILQPMTMKVERANAAAARMFGPSMDSLVGRGMLEMLADISRKDEFARTIATKLPFLKTIHLDLEMRRANGSLFPALHGISEITDEQGNVIAWIWIVTDMTQRVFLNRALIDLETRYRLLFDRSADPTLIIDARSRKIIDANAAADAQLGYKREELIGLEMDDITPESRRGGMEVEFDSIPIGGTITVNGVNLSRSGVEIPVQISVVATDFEGRKVYIASCRDTSQQRSLEQERLRTEKLDAARKVAGGLAHEFSQPLQSLMTIVDLIKEPALNESAQLDLIQKISPSVERMVVLLDQMKRIVRLEIKTYTGSDDIVDIHHSTNSED